jgi:Flp pilus assembly pilin Flp
MYWLLLVLHDERVPRPRTWRDRLQPGQGTVEYALVVALVVLACAVSLGVLGTHMSGVFSDIGNTLVDHDSVDSRKPSPTATSSL